VTPDQRRIVAVEAHRRRSGRCPVRVHALGTGETFDIAPSPDGFLDVETGIAVRSNGDRIVLPSGPIDLILVGDVFFEGVANGEHFTGRAGGGASVTLYSDNPDDYFQYAVVAEGDHT
jgi:hypothetical protein